MDKNEGKKEHRVWHKIHRILTPEPRHGPTSRHSSSSAPESYVVEGNQSNDSTTVSVSREELFLTPDASQQGSYQVRSVNTATTAAVHNELETSITDTVVSASSTHQDVEQRENTDLICRFSRQ